MELHSFEDEDLTTSDGEEEDDDSSSMEFVATPVSPEDDHLLERELKMRLGGFQDWQAVKSWLGDTYERLEQRNYYFDTASGVLAKGRAMLRVRQENERFLLVYKRGVDYQSGYFQAIEIETAISKEQFEGLQRGEWDTVENLPPIRCLRIEGIDEPLYIIGEADNLRLRFPLENGDYLELDRTTFNDGSTDYEIEVETVRPSQVMAILNRMQEALYLDMSEQTRTKYERFLASVK